MLTLDFFTPWLTTRTSSAPLPQPTPCPTCSPWGGKPVTALNILAFPSCMGTRSGGRRAARRATKVREAGAFVVGGHSIEDDEPKYGLSVFGLVHPERMVRNGGGQPGDALYHENVGTGIMNAALRASCQNRRGPTPGNRRHDGA